MFNYIHGDRFKEVAHTTISEKRSFIPRFRKPEIILAPTYHADEVLKRIGTAYNLRKKFVLITHNSDAVVKERRLPSNLIRWYAQNCLFKHPKLVPIPIGIERPHVGRCGKFEVIHSAKRNTASKNVKAYLNFTVGTNSGERQRCFQTLYNRDCIVNDMNSSLDFSTYIEHMTRHSFVVSPPGNGPDCIRTWEALYAGVTPIVKRSVFTESFQDLPISIVDDWSEITTEFLFKEIDRICGSEWTFDKLNIQYWLKLIREDFENAR